MHALVLGPWDSLTNLSLLGGIEECRPELAFTVVSKTTSFSAWCGDTLVSPARERLRQERGWPQFQGQPQLHSSKVAKAAW